VNSTETPVSFKHSILIIDDDTELTDMLDSYLRTCGYSITVADNGLEGLNVASGGAVFDLILLDVMMPGMDGFDVLKNLRKTLLTPVLMLTARGDDYDRILGLELGADDYLPKPFNHRELAARIKAILRRLELTGVAFQQQDLLVHGLRLSVARQQVSCDGQEVALTGTEFSILHLLMLNAGMLVTKKEISEKVLAKKMMTYDRSIDMHVSNLRKKIAAVNAEEKIKTIRGSGYLLIIG